jgi:DNA-binding MarR family transcriptional regulator
MTLPADSVCTCFRLRRAARQVSQIYDRELAVVDLSLNEYSILRHTERNARLLGELAESLGMERTTLTRNLKPLLDAGWLKESRGEDARQRFIAITAGGRRRLVSARPHWQRAQQYIDSSFGTIRAKRLREDLDLLDAVLRSPPGVSA